jgi:hypothetical protein
MYLLLVETELHLLNIGALMDGRRRIMYFVSFYFLQKFLVAKAH